jgi:hypothetical protein
VALRLAAARGPDIRITAIAAGGRPDDSANIVSRSWLTAPLRCLIRPQPRDQVPGDARRRLAGTILTPMWIRILIVRRTRRASLQSAIAKR